MENRQPWLCQGGSAKSLKSPPYLPAASVLPAGQSRGRQAGSASPHPQHPGAAVPGAVHLGHILLLALPRDFGSPPASSSRSHWHPHHLTNPTQASGALGHTPRDCPCADPTPNGCQRLEKRKNNVLGRARRSLASTSREVFYHCQAPGTLPQLVWGCPVQG